MRYKTKTSSLTTAKLTINEQTKKEEEGRNERNKFWEKNEK